MQELLEAVNLGMTDEMRQVWVSSLLALELKKPLVKVLWEHREYFSRDYYKMLDLDQNLVENKLPVHSEAKPIR